MTQRLAKILTITALISVFFPISSIFTATKADVREQKSIAPTAAITLPFLNSDTDFPEISKGQKLAMFTKPSVVRVLDGYRAKIYWGGNTKTYIVTCGGSSSGFFISPDGYIVTNAHATYRTHEGEENGKDCLFEEFVKQLSNDVTFTHTENGQEYEVNWQYVLKDPDFVRIIQEEMETVQFEAIHHVILPDGSAFPFEIKAYGAPVGEGKDVAVIKIETENTPSLKLGNSEQTQLQEHITVAGYPAAAETFDSGVLDEKSSLEASFTDGKISSQKKAADGAPILQISAPVSHGSSGGPVVNDQGEVVGILTFRGDKVEGEEVSGFAFAVPAKTIMEFVKQAGTTNEQGTVSRLYKEGLELYWQRYYSKAIEKFEDVKGLFPEHSEAEELIQSSKEEILKGNERSDFPTWAIPVILVSGGGVAGALYYQRRRKQKQPLSLSSKAGTKSESDAISVQIAQSEHLKSNIEKFTKIVETCHGQAKISPAQKQMLEHFRQKYNIPKEVAEQLITQATQQTDKQPNPQAFYEFSLMYRAFLEHDRVQDPEEKAQLTKLQEELGLTNEQVIQIETRVKEEAKV